MTCFGTGRRLESMTGYQCCWCWATCLHHAPSFPNSFTTPSTPQHTNALEEENRQEVTASRWVNDGG